MHSGVDDVVRLLEKGASATYPGERVTLLQHALQCARLTEEAGAPPELVVACLLHDLGHLLPCPAEEHPFAAARFLADLFPLAVVNPIRLHADARRYLLRADPDYVRCEGRALDDAATHAFLME